MSSANVESNKHILRPGDDTDDEQTKNRASKYRIGTKKLAIHITPHPQSKAKQI